MLQLNTDNVPPNGRSSSRLIRLRAAFTMLQMRVRHPAKGGDGAPRMLEPFFTRSPLSPRLHVFGPLATLNANNQCNTLAQIHYACREFSNVRIRAYEMQYASASSFEHALSFTMHPKGNVSFRMKRFFIHFFPADDSRPFVSTTYLPSFVCSARPKVLSIYNSRSFLGTVRGLCSVGVEAGSILSETVHVLPLDFVGGGRT